MKADTKIDPKPKKTAPMVKQKLKNMERAKRLRITKGMLPDDIVKILAACEKKLFTSDSEDEKVENKSASRKRRPKKPGSEPVI